MGVEKKENIKITYDLGLMDGIEVVGLPIKMTKETLSKRHDMYLRKPPSYLRCVALRLHSCSCTALYFLPTPLAFDCGRYRATYSSSLLCGGNCPRQIRGNARLRPHTHTHIQQRRRRRRRRVLPSFIYCPCCQMLEREKRGLRKKRERELPWPLLSERTPLYVVVYSAASLS